MQPNIESFKNCMGRFATGITVITAHDKQMNYLGITVNSFNSVSLNPLLILFSLDKSASIYQRFLEQNQFTISILSGQQQEISRIFTKPSSVKWHEINHFLSINNKLPVITDSLAYLDCERVQLVEAGDHTIIIGKVVNIEIMNQDNPLIYYRRDYYQLGNDEVL